MSAAERLSALYQAERARILALPGAAGVYDAPVFGEGNPAPALLLIGEAPGAEEVKLGRPFVGKAGRQLDALLAQMGLPREALYVTNAVKYRPVSPSARGQRNRTPSLEEVRAGLPLLREELLLLRPRIIATLGNVPLAAMRLLAGQGKATVGACHGAAMEIALEGFETRLYPMYHPASCIYNRALLPVLEADAARLGSLL